MAIVALLSVTYSPAQIKNALTENVKIYGNCAMCETTIEKAGTLKGIAKVDWDKDTKMALITYDQEKTDQGEILKRIALAGYDSEQFLAPTQAYEKLPACCRYERGAKTETVRTETMDHGTMHAEHGSSVNTPENGQDENQLDPIFDSYFSLKDALVRSDGPSGTTQAAALLSVIKEVKMEKLSPETHMIWMKVLKGLTSSVEQIRSAKDVGQQRNHFGALSDHMLQLLKVAGQATPTYVQHCPMYNDGEGANWLSKERTVKNPYYGAQMLSCGKTVETVQ